MTPRGKSTTREGGWVMSLLRVSMKSYKPYGLMEKLYGQAYGHICPFDPENLTFSSI